MITSYYPIRQTVHEARKLLARLGYTYGLPKKNHLYGASPIEVKTISPTLGRGRFTVYQPSESGFFADMTPLEWAYRQIVEADLRPDGVIDWPEDSLPPIPEAETLIELAETVEDISRLYLVRVALVQRAQAEGRPVAATATAAGVKLNAVHKMRKRELPAGVDAPEGMTIDLIAQTVADIAAQEARRGELVCQAHQLGANAHTIGFFADRGRSWVHDTIKTQREKTTTTP